MKSGSPSPKLSTKNTKKPSSGLPVPATQVKSPRTKGPIQGAAITPSVNP